MTFYYTAGHKVLLSKSKNRELRNRRTEKPTNKIFRWRKPVVSKRRASKGEAKEMSQTEEGAVNGGKGQSLLLVSVF
ncbi:hypothetical protein IGI04_035811 [Brassica rapa subsp. trilocularis]|uniref:Uncharacterized protein n=1 Tax=Brassica rapa subsp. trilocularis TaxID=1813537 RepID=A0ABQ7LF09_BRACM|nr:hypothetical protein IGI04_035811 [Brassica rapa subsp. trilocularis]